MKDEEDKAMLTKMHHPKQAYPLFAKQKVSYAAASTWLLELNEIKIYVVAEDQIQAVTRIEHNRSRPHPH